MQFRKSRLRSHCPNCLYIGDPHKCSCMWTMRQVVEGKGNDPRVIENAQKILSIAKGGDAE